MTQNAANDPICTPDVPSRSLSFATFYIALFVALAAACFWNAPRLSARADMENEPMRSWILAGVDTLAGESTRTRLAALHRALSLPVDSSNIDLPVLPTWAARVSAPPLPASKSVLLPASTWVHTPKALIFFAGDSLANGYAAGAARSLIDARSTAVARDEGKISSGLTNSSYFDWPARARALCKERPAAFIFSFGSNDTGDLREGGIFLRFGDPAWQQAYARRAQQMIDIARGCGARSVWLQLPPMREISMSRNAKVLNAAQAAACEAADACVAPFEDLESPLASLFKERALIDGKFRLLRAADGVHMGPEGYRLVSRQALRRLGTLPEAVPSNP